MKIALLTTDMKSNGVCQFVLSLGRGLVLSGDIVVVVTTCQKGTRWQELELSRLAGKHIPARYWQGTAQHSLAIARYLKSQNFDIVISNVGWLNSAGQHSLRFLSAYTHSIVILHNHFDKVYQTGQISRKAYDTLVAVSPAIFKNVVSEFSGKPVRFIPYGIEIPTHDQLKHRVNVSFPLQLIYVGRLIDSQKGVFLIPPILLECISRGLNVRLTVIGEGRDRGELDRLIRAAGLQDLVEFRGELHNTQVHSAMREHHVLIAPSYFEGFPFVIIEAQANGCVPVASRIAGVTDAAIDDGKTGYLASMGDFRSFADHIEALSNREQWQHLSQAGISRVRSGFSSKIMLRNYNELLGSFSIKGGRSFFTSSIMSSLKVFVAAMREFHFRDFISSELCGDLLRLTKKIGKFKS